MVLLVAFQRSGFTYTAKFLGAVLSSFECSIHDNGYMHGVVFACVLGTQQNRMKVA